MGIFKLNVERMRKKKDTKGLIKALKHRKSVVRYRAVAALGEIRDVRAVDDLIQTLKDEDKNVRLEATRALGKIGDTRAVEPLIHSLKDESWSVRSMAAWALGETGNTRAVKPLIQTLKDRNLHVRQRAAEALGMIGDTRAVEPLIESLKDTSVQSFATMALDGMGEQAVEPLIQTLEDEDWPVRHRAVKALDMRTRTSLEVASLVHDYFQAGPGFLAANLPIRDYFQAMPVYLSKRREMNLKSLLKGLTKYLEAYQRLIEIGESKMKLDEEWRSELENYRAIKADIESKISVIGGLCARISIFPIST